MDGNRPNQTYAQVVSCDGTRMIATASNFGARDPGGAGPRPVVSMSCPPPSTCRQPKPTVGRLGAALMQPCQGLSNFLSPRAVSRPQNVKGGLEFEAPFN